MACLQELSQVDRCTVCALSVGLRPMLDRGFCSHFPWMDQVTLPFNVHSDLWDRVVGKM